jgi:hypothetical protein
MYARKRPNDANITRWAGAGRTTYVWSVIETIPESVAVSKAAIVGIVSSAIVVIVSTDIVRQTLPYFRYGTRCNHRPQKVQLCLPSMTTALSVRLLS